MLSQADKRKRNRTSTDTYYAHKRMLLEQLKTTCVICQEKLPPYCLDFHHLHDKKCRIVEINLCSHVLLIAELAKCVVVCANCHRKIHWGNLPCPHKPLDYDNIARLVHHYRYLAHKESQRALGLSHTNDDPEARFIECAGITWVTSCKAIARE